MIYIDLLGSHQLKMYSNHVIKCTCDNIVANFQQNTQTQILQYRVTSILYRIVGNFRGVQFSRFSQISGYPRKLDLRNKYDCTVYNGHDGARPRKLNRENFADWPSAKIGPHENFPLYSSLKQVHVSVHSDTVGNMLNVKEYRY